MKKHNNQEKTIPIKDIAISDIDSMTTFFPNQQIGIKDKEAREYQNKYGLNKLKDIERNPLKDIILTILSPFNCLLFFIVIFEFVQFLILKNKNPIDSKAALIGGIIVSCMIILSVSVELTQEYNFHKTNSKLHNLISNDIHIIRNFSFDSKINFENFNKKVTTINSEYLVLGDIIHISAGDIMPADIRILYSKNLLMDESSITGENKFIHKSSQPDKDHKFAFSNICYTGSNVISGYAYGVVIKRIQYSFLNDLSKKTEAKNKKKTNFEIAINKITKIIILVIIVLVPIICIINGLKNQFFIAHSSDISITEIWLNALVFAIAVSVGLIPESLPVILSANLNRGSKKLADKKILIKSTDSIQDLSSIDVLCSDKTGTITQNKIIVENYYDCNFDTSFDTLKFAYLNSYYQKSFTNNLIDNALLKTKKTSEISLKNIKKINEIPFDFKKRILSILIKNDNKNIMISKGAIEEILALSTQYEEKDKIYNLTTLKKQKIYDKLIEISNNGFKIIAVSYKNINDNLNDTTEKGSILKGFITFSDKPKKNIEKLISNLRTKYGVNFKIISGDSEKNTIALCKKINFDTTNIFNGNKDKITENNVNKSNIFCKIAPNQKSEIIEKLQKNHKVAFVGDGINDAIALKQANAGISVNNAKEISKNASDFILLKKDLYVIEDGFIESRKIFGNIIKYVKITLANKFGLLLTYIISTIWLNIELMTPFQILFLDLLFDFTQMAVILDTVPKSYAKIPRDWEMSNWIRFSLINGSISALIAFINFAVIGYGFLNMQHNPIDSNSLNATILHTSTFLEIGLIYIISIFSLRKESFIFSKKNNSPWRMNLIIISFLCFIMGLPFIPWANGILKLTNQIPPFWYLCLFMYGVLYLLIQEVVKKIYIKKYGVWL